MSPTSCQFEANGQTYAAEFIGTREDRTCKNWWACDELGLEISGNISETPVAEFIEAAEGLNQEDPTL